MAESLNVVALISGGKDSFFSLLHCLQNGHKVVALGNLYPASPSSEPRNDDFSRNGETNENDDHDLNSFMYQTVGHTVIPLFEKALGIPLYRQPIIGTAIQTGTSYSHADAATAEYPISELEGERGSSDEVKDETESLVPLLEKIIAEHPTVNALCTGAILSTYQRTRIESVALRLGLTPLSFLWKYPILPPVSQVSLLQDMQAVGLDARIVKVASGGLDESFLWENVSSEATIRRMERAMKKFGTDGDGAVLGEGGEFETLVINGPSTLFKGRIEIQENDRKTVKEGGGSAWLRILNARVVMKSEEATAEVDCRIPDQLESRFRELLHDLNVDRKCGNKLFSGESTTRSLSPSLSKNPRLSRLEETQDGIVYWTISSHLTGPSTTVSEMAEQILTVIKQRLAASSLEPSNIISTLIILRSMADFAAVNQVYGSLFTQPNPPARVTISCGSTMPKGINLIIHLKVSTQSLSPSSRKALHVQSRSYWAPANIGPYSQAIAIPMEKTEDQNTNVWTVDVAGQIALVPSSMMLPPAHEALNTSEVKYQYLEGFKLQTILSLQHLWRIGCEMDISWWTSAVAYLPRGPLAEIQKRAQIACQAWMKIHARDTPDEEDEDEEVRDLWEEKHYAGMQKRGGSLVEKVLPDWEAVEVGDGATIPCSPFFVVEVEELPRGSSVEWHAHLGVVGGRIKLDVMGKDDSWTVHQCEFGNRIQLVLTLSYSENSVVLSSRLTAAFNSLGGESVLQKCIYLSYLDDSMESMKEAWKLKGVIPCRSIWDVAGKRVSAILLLDIFL